MMGRASEAEGPGTRGGLQGAHHAFRATPSRLGIRKCRVGDQIARRRLEAHGSRKMRLKSGIAPGLAFAATTIALRLTFLGLPFDAHDEGYYAAVAKETVRGSRLYADLWYMRPPLLNSVYAGSYRFSLGTGVPYDLSVRLLAGLFAAITVGIVASVLFAEFSPRAAFLGSTFAALAGASLTLQNEANSETWMMLPYTLSALLLLHVALREPPLRRGGMDPGPGRGSHRDRRSIQAGRARESGATRSGLDGVRSPSRSSLAGVHRRLHRRELCVVWAGILAGLVMTDDLRAFLYFAWFRNAVYVKYSHAELEPMLLLLQEPDGTGLRIYGHRGTDSRALRCRTPQARWVATRAEDRALRFWLARPVGHRHLGVRALLHALLHPGHHPARTAALSFCRRVPHGRTPRAGSLDRHRRRTRTCAAVTPGVADDRRREHPVHVRQARILQGARCSAAAAHGAGRQRLSLGQYAPA